MMNKFARAAARPGVSPRIIRGAKRWHYFMASIEAASANDEQPSRSPKRSIRARDLVMLNRDLLVAGHTIPNGSFGIVRVERFNYGMYDVQFLNAHDLCVTLSADDLEAVF